MIQMILKAAFRANRFPTSQYFSLGGIGDIPNATTFGINYASMPVPIDGTFSKLIVYSAESHPGFDITLMKNGLATVLSVALDSDSITASNSSDSVSFEVGDDVCFKVTNQVPEVGDNYIMSVGVEFEAAEQFYGMQAWQGGSSPGTTNEVHRAGILFNGQNSTQAWPISALLSNNYSIVSVDGTVTSLYQKTYSGAPGSGVWTGYLVLNTILQDGTGGSVNTETVMTGVDETSSSTFSLPIVQGDHLEFVVRRTVTSQAFALANIAASITFTPDDERSWMNTGGSNAAVSAVDIGWIWVATEQLNDTEVQSNVPVASDGVLVTGLYVEIDAPPGLGTSYTYMLRLNGEDTSVTFTIADEEITGVIDDLAVSLSAGDVITLQITPSNEPSNVNHFWGLITVPEPQVGGIYKIIPWSAKPEDTLYINVDSEETFDVKIPDPTVVTALIGE